MSRLYDLRIWRDQIRPQKLRSNPLCEDCEKRGLVVVATDVDHVDGDEWNNAAENHRSLCHTCHSLKTVRKDGGLGFKPGEVRERGNKLDGTPIDTNHHWNVAGGTSEN